MKVRIEVVSLNTDGEEQRQQILTIERRELAMQTLGVNLAPQGRETRSASSLHDG